MLFLVNIFPVFSQNIQDTSLASEYYDLANYYYSEGNIDSSTFCFLKAADIYKQIAEVANNKQIWEKYVGCIYDVVWNYNLIAEFDSSLNILSEIIPIAIDELGEKNHQTALIYKGFGLVYYYLNEFDESLRNYQKSLDILIYLYGENNYEVAKLYNNIAIVYSEISNYDMALENHYKSLNLKLLLIGKINSSVALSYRNIGNIFLQKYELEKALIYYFRSLDINKEVDGENSLNVAANLNNIGIVYNTMSQYDKALEYYQLSLKIKLTILDEKDLQIADAYNNIGNVFANKGDYNNALHFYDKSFFIYSEVLGENSLDVADIYYNIALIYTEQEKFEKALELYDKALEIRIQFLGDNNVDFASIYNSIALTYSFLADFNSAFKFYHLAMCESLFDFNDVYNIYAVPSTKNYANFHELIISILGKTEIITKTNVKDLDLSNKYEYALELYLCADSLITNVRKQITNQSDKLWLGNTAFEIYTEAIDLLLNNQFSIDDIEQAFYFSEKNKSSVLLEALAGAEAQKYAGIPQKLLEKENTLRDIISTTQSLLVQSSDKNEQIQLSAKLFNYRISYDSLINYFETEFPKYYDLKYNTTPVSISELQNNLDKKTTLLSYTIGANVITIFVISIKNKMAIQVPINEDFSKKIELFRSSISDVNVLTTEVSTNKHNSVDLYQKLAFEFYNLFFPEEIQNFLKKNRTKRLIIVPDGEIAKIPFESFLTGKYSADWTNWQSETYFAEMPFLIKKYAISYSYSATLFCQTRPKEKSEKIEISPMNDWIGFAPVFDDENISGTTRQTRQMLEYSTRCFMRGDYITPIPATENEVESIFNLFNEHNLKAVSKTHQQASENAVKTADLQNYRIIHFATHGLVNEEKPELSAILLAQDTTSNSDSLAELFGNVTQQNEGFLYQSEIYNLKFNADLVVLSACETGLGKISDGEGVIGLTRALLYAGTKNLIVSLWQVDDERTKELMASFYDNLLNSPFKKGARGMYSKHLRKAKLQMIEEGKYAHPYFWSSFILIGE